MESFPFKEKPNDKVYICRHLLEGEALKKVYHFNTDEFVWSFMCEAEQHGKEDIMETTIAQAFEKYPEIAQLAGCKANCMLVKGEDSDKWFEFHFKD